MRERVFSILAMALALMRAQGASADDLSLDAWRNPDQRTVQQILDPAREGLAVKRGERIGVVLSNETDRIDRMLAWGRIRAGAQPGEAVELFRIDVVRFVEAQTK